MDIGLDLRVNKKNTGDDPGIVYVDGAPHDAKTAKWKAVMSSWGYSDWEKAGNASPNFEGFSLYIIKCTGNGEEFIKIGKTYVGTAKRFSNASAMPYKYKVVTQVYHNAYAISKLEEKIKRALKEYKYNPKRDFGGKEECLTMEALDKAIEMAEK